MSQAGDGPPTADEFSRRAVQKAVLVESATHPATLYPGVIGILGGVAGMVFANPGLFLLAVGGGLTALAGFTVNFFFRDRAIADKYFAGLLERKAKGEERALQTLHEDLLGCTKIYGAVDHATQAAQQFVEIQEKHSSLVKVLEEKIGSGNLELGAVWGAADQVRSGAIENLSAVLAALRSAEAIDLPYIYERLTKLERLRNLAPADKREKDTLVKRKLLREAQLEKANELLAKNEEALTRIGEVIIAAAEINPEGIRNAALYETSLQRLQQLAGSLRETRPDAGG